MLALAFTVPAFAITEDDVEAKVNAVGKETVTGNVLIWFLCAVGFLKVSQKIDSFMASLGINVGHTGGSLLSEAMIAAKSVSTVMGSGGRILGGSGSKSPGPAGASGGTGFFRGGLAGIVSRKVTNDAIRTATSTTHAAATHKATESAARYDQGVSVESQFRSAEKTHGESNQNTQTATSTHQTSSSVKANAFETTRHFSSLGGSLFASSLQSGGTFANNVIGHVAKGDIRTTGSITGDLAAQSLMSYMGQTSLSEQSTERITYRDVEIGGGRITGIEVSEQHPDGIAFSMYHTDQYTRPEGDFSKVFSADGAQWYKQYAADTVVKKPYETPGGEIAYHSEIVKKLPQPPKRKDRI